MVVKITETSMKVIAEEISDVFIYSDNRQEFMEKIQEILESNGIVEVIPD